mgnify:CR=1 FL=1
MFQLYKDFGFKEGISEVDIGILDNMDYKFPMAESGDFEIHEVNKFLEAFQKGKLLPHGSKFSILFFGVSQLDITLIFSMDYKALWPFHIQLLVKIGEFELRC